VNVICPFPMSRSQQRCPFFSNLNRYQGLMRFWAFGLWLGFGILFASCAWATEEPSPEGVLAGILKSGQIRVGIKTDFPPFGMLNAQGEPEGLEVDLAHDIANRLGAELVLVRVSTENRFQKLEQGAVDLVIATAADTIERRKIVTAVEPGYYAGGVTVMVPPNVRVQDWAALRGKSVCATQGAYFNRPMSERYLLNLVIYRDTRDALLGLRDGRCMAYLYTGSAIHAFLQKEEWAGYTAPLPSAMITPWTMMLSRQERGGAFERQLGDIVVQWHQSGFIVALERKWNIPSSEYVERMRQQWSEKAPSGDYVCARQADGQWPLGCRNTAIITSAEATGLWNLGLLLKEKTGIDLSFIYDPFDRGRFLKGLIMTMFMMLACIVSSLALGLAWALVADARWKWLGALARGLGVHARMTPPLLQMYLLFFGVGGLLFSRFGLGLYPVFIAVFCMSYYTAGAIMNSLYQVAEHRRLTEAPDFRISVSSLLECTLLARGPVMGSLINVMKQTVIASAIAVPELLLVSLAIMADQGNVNVMMNVLLASYFILIVLAIRLLGWCQKRLEAWATGKAGIHA
jgi:polar amino acid transport system substrate-binding protein